MADTRRELAALQTLFADNSGGAITPQYGRDELISSHPSQTVQSGTYASIPATGQVTGDLYFCTDGPQVFRWSGSLWVPYGPVWKLGDATGQTWSWVNQGSATIASVGTGQTLYSPTNGGANSLRARVMTAPATPYTFSALIATSADWSSAQYSGAGILFRESSSGKMIHVSLETQSGSGAAALIRVTKWTDATTVSSTPSSLSWTGGNQLWIQLSDDGTNRKIKVGSDGLTWPITLLSEARTTFLTANQVGFGVNPYSQGNMVSVLSWLQG